MKKSDAEEKETDSVNNDNRGDDADAPASAAASSPTNANGSATSIGKDDDDGDSPLSSSTIAAFHDVQMILAAYDADGDRQLSTEELDVALQEYQQVHTHQPPLQEGEDENELYQQQHQPIIQALARYDQDQDGNIDGHEIKALYTDLDTSETIFKYLAFVGSLSTMGKVIRTVDNAASAAGSATNDTRSINLDAHQKSGAAAATTTTRTGATSKKTPSMYFWQHTAASQGRKLLVPWSWRVTYGYVVTDTLWEGYTHYLKHQTTTTNTNNNNNKDTNDEESPISMAARHVASRACFNVAMVYTSMYTVKYTLQLTFRLLEPFQPNKLPPPLRLIMGRAAAATPPPWLIPCLVSTVAVLNIPTLVAHPLKQAIGTLFGTATTATTKTATTQ